MIVEFELGNLVFIEGGLSNVARLTVFCFKKATVGSLAVHARLLYQSLVEVL